MRMLLAMLLLAPLTAARAQHVVPVAGRAPTIVVVRPGPGGPRWDERSHVTAARNAGVISSRRRSATGGIVGALAGGVLGGVVGCLANEDDYGVFCGGQSDTKVFVGVALGAVVGAIIGSRIF